MRRSARIADAAYLAPQVGFDDVAHLISIYRDERSVTGQDAGHITISRGVALAKDKETAIAQARESAASSYKMYSSWNMQEDTMVKINIASDSEVSAWAVSGNGDDCLQDLGRLAADGVEYVGMTLLNMPKDLSGRKEYIQALAENVLHRMK